MIDCCDECVSNEEVALAHQHIHNNVQQEVRAKHLLEYFRGEQLNPITDAEIAYLRDQTAILRTAQRTQDYQNKKALHPYREEDTEMIRFQNDICGQHPNPDILGFWTECYRRQKDIGNTGRPLTQEDMVYYYRNLFYITEFNPWPQLPPPQSRGRILDDVPMTFREWRGENQETTAAKELRFDVELMWETNSYIDYLSDFPDELIHFGEELGLIVKREQAAFNFLPVPIPGQDLQTIGLQSWITPWQTSGFIMWEELCDRYASYLGAETNESEIQRFMDQRAALTENIRSQVDDIICVGAYNEEATDEVHEYLEMTIYEQFLEGSLPLSPNERQQSETDQYHCSTETLATEISQPDRSLPRDSESRDITATLAPAAYLAHLRARRAELEQRIGLQATDEAAQFALHGRNLDLEGESEIWQALPQSQEPPHDNLNSQLSYDEVREIAEQANEVRPRDDPALQAFLATLNNYSSSQMPRLMVVNLQAAVNHLIDALEGGYTRINWDLIGRFMEQIRIISQDLRYTNERVSPHYWDSLTRLFDLGGFPYARHSEEPEQESESEAQDDNLSREPAPILARTQVSNLNGMRRLRRMRSDSPHWGVSDAATRNFHLVHNLTNRQRISVQRENQQRRRERFSLLNNIRPNNRQSRRSRLEVEDPENEMGIVWEPDTEEEACMSEMDDDEAAHLNLWRMVPEYMEDLHREIEERENENVEIEEYVYVNPEIDEHGDQIPLMEMSAMDYYALRGECTPRWDSEPMELRVVQDNERQPLSG
jgi:hypothetical protein